MCTIVLWTKVVVEFISSIERIAAIKKRKQNAMRVSLTVSASNNRAKLFLAPAANIVFLILLILLKNLSNTVPNSFGISNKVLLGKSD